MLKKSFVAVLVFVSAAAVVAQAPAFKRTVLQTVDLSIPERQAVTGKAEFPGGATTGRHTHPGEEIGYLLEGSVSVEMDGVAKTLKPGDTFAVPAGKVHMATNLGTGPAAILSTYIVEKGKPLATPAK